MSDRISGSCLCGGITFDVQPAAIVFMSNCHCTSCQKMTGSGCATTLQVRRSGFSWLTGEQLIASYESSPKVFRTFCSVCGSPMPQVSQLQDNVSIPAGVVSDVLDHSPQVNMWVDHSAAWMHIDQSVPKCVGRGSPEFWSELLGGSVELYAAAQAKIDQRLED